MTPTNWSEMFHLGFSKGMVPCLLVADEEPDGDHADEDDDFTPDP